MIRTVEAIVDEQGTVRLLESVKLPNVRRALVTILEEKPSSYISEAALLSEAALAEDWDRPEEDAAWAHLQQERQYSYRSRSRTCRGPSCDLRLSWQALGEATGCYVGSPAIVFELPLPFRQVSHRDSVANTLGKPGHRKKRLS
ncbi:MAG: hypothetical protein ACRDTR_01510 [Rubrobacter sp.]